MLDTAITGGLTGTTAQGQGSGAAGPASASKKVLHWRVNERMGGKIPVWEPSTSAKEQITGNLADAADSTKTESFENAMAYADAGQNAAENSDEEFGFGDLIDMVNPLQHLPIVGYVYREITGDEIKPISQIIGGGIFGGVAGAAAGLVNTVVEYETGKDVTGNVMALALNGETPTYRTETAGQTAPERELNKAIKSLEEDPSALPGSVIGFADLGYGKREVYERIPAADGRTAGSMVRKRIEVAAPEAAPREPITQLKLDPMPLILRREMSDN